MIRIEIRPTRRFRYFWLKSIRGFNPRVHCARCLVGDYHTGLSPEGIRAGEVINIDLDGASAPVHYLCGVSGTWKNNFHVAFAADPGSGPLTIESWGITVNFPDGGVRRIDIMPPITAIDPAFGTCRNWLFGKQYFESFQSQGGPEGA